MPKKRKKKKNRKRKSIEAQIEIDEEKEKDSEKIVQPKRKKRKVGKCNEKNQQNKGKGKSDSKRSKRVHSVKHKKKGMASVKKKNTTEQSSKPTTNQKALDLLLKNVEEEKTEIHETPKSTPVKASIRQAINNFSPSFSADATPRHDKNIPKQVNFSKNDNEQGENTNELSLESPKLVTQQTKQQSQSETSAIETRAKKRGSANTI